MFTFKVLLISMACIANSYEVLSNPANKVTEVARLELVSSDVDGFLSTLKV